MLSLQRTLSLGYLAQHPTRVALVVVSIALGVGTLVATRSLDDVLHQAAEKAVNPFATFADILIVNGATGVPADLADRLNEAHLPGLAEARPLVMGRAALVDLDGQTVLLLGIQLFSDESQDPAKALAGDNPWGLEYSPSHELAGVAWALATGAKPVVLGAKLAERMKGLPNGTHEFTLRRVAGAEQKVTAIGTVRLPERAKALEDEAVFADLRTAASIIYPQRPDYATQLNLKVTPGARLEDVRKEVAQYLKEHDEPGQVQTVQDTEAMDSDITGGLELAFSVGGYLVLLVGLFLVYNALSVSVAERRHDIGVLRSVGATRGQVAGLFIGEALLLGLAGSLLGLPFGYALAWLSLGPMHQVLSEAFAKLPDTTVSVSWPAMLLAVGAGLTTALLASLVPALQAAEEEPADAVRRAPRTTRPLYFAVQMGAVLFLAAVGIAAAVFRTHLPQRVGAFVTPLCLMIAVLVAMPLLAAAVGRLLQPFFRFFLGLQGRLAADNLVRSPGRTGVVIAALAATGGLLVDTAGFTQSTAYALTHWIDENVGADLYVTAGSSISSPGVSLPMDENVGRTLAKMPQVEVAEPVRFHYFIYDDQYVNMIALDLDAFRGVDEGRAVARNLSRFPGLREPRTAVMSENFGALHHVRVGDTVRIPGRTTPTIALKIIGTVVDYTWQRGTLLVDRTWYARAFADDQVDLFEVYLLPGVDARDFQKELTKPGGWAGRNAVFVARRDELRDAISSQLERIYHLAYAQEFVVGLVALLGVVSALFISVLQRRRELGLLRAVGASRGQVLGSVLAEAALMGLVGAVIGLLLGLVLEWYTVNIMVLDEAGFVFPMLIPWASAAVVFGGSVVAATAVGLWPAWRATRLRIPEAIAYE